MLLLAADPIALREVQRELEDDYDVVACDDPVEALVGFVRGDLYDVVICDAGFPFVPTGEFRDRVAAMNQAQSERIVILTFAASERATTGARASRPHDISHLKDQIAELVQLRTVPPRAPFGVSR